MDEDEFEGTLVLEQLAAIGTVDDFFEAIDADARSGPRRLPPAWPATLDHDSGVTKAGV